MNMTPEMLDAGVAEFQHWRELPKQNWFEQWEHHRITLGHKASRTVARTISLEAFDRGLLDDEIREIRAQAPDMEVCRRHVYGKFLIPAHRMFRRFPEFLNSPR